MKCSGLVLAVLITNLRLIRSENLIVGLYKDYGGVAKNFTSIEYLAGTEIAIVSGVNFTSVINTKEWPPKLEHCAAIVNSRNDIANCVSGLLRYKDDPNFSGRHTSLLNNVCYTGHAFMATVTPQNYAGGKVDNEKQLKTLVCFTNSNASRCADFTPGMQTTVDMRKAEYFQPGPKSVAAHSMHGFTFLSMKNPLDPKSAFIWRVREKGLSPEVRTAPWHFSGDVEFISAHHREWQNDGNNPDKGVYFFFNENAEEVKACRPRKRYARISRLIPEDEGFPRRDTVSDDSIHKPVFSMFVKARLHCEGFWENTRRTISFDRLMSTAYEAHTGRLFGLFTVGIEGSDLHYGSAICAYQMDSIKDEFIGGSRTGALYNYAPTQPSRQWRDKAESKSNMEGPEALLPPGFSTEDIAAEGKRLQQHYLLSRPIESDVPAIFANLRVRLEYIQATSVKYHDEKGGEKRMIVLFTTDMVKQKYKGYRRHLWKIIYFPTATISAGSSRPDLSVWPAREELMPYYSPEGTSVNRLLDRDILDFRIVNKEQPYLLVLAENSVAALKIDFCSQFIKEANCKAACHMLCKWQAKGGSCGPGGLNYTHPECISRPGLSAVNTDEVYKDPICAKGEPRYYSERVGFVTDDCLVKIPM